MAVKVGGGVRSTAAGIARSPRQGRDFRSKEKIEEEKRRRKLFTILFGCLVGLLIVGFFVLVRLSFLRITDITIIGTKGIKSEIVHEFIKQKLDNPSWILIPYNSSIFFDRKEMVTSVKRKFPQINSLSIQLSGVHKLNVHIIERSRYALWCGSAQDVSKSKQCVYLDENGYAYDDAPSIEGVSFFTFYHEEYDVPKKHIYFQKPQRFIETRLFIEALKENGFDPRSYTITKESMDAKIAIGQHNTRRLSGNILISNSIHPKDTLRRLMILVKKQIFSEIQKQESGGLPFAYIDIRFGNKVFYKFGNEYSVFDSIDTVATTTETLSSTQLLQQVISTAPEYEQE